MGQQLVMQMETLPKGREGDTLYTVSSSRSHLVPNIWYRITERTPTHDGFLHTELYGPGNYVVHVQGKDVKGNSTTFDVPVSFVP